MKTSEGFSLIETVLALGVFAGGILVLLGFLSPTIQAVEEHGTIGSAERAAQSVLAYLSERDFDGIALAGLVDGSDVESLPTLDDRKLLVDRLGERVGTKGDVDAWGFERSTDAQWFEAILIRSETAAPSSEALSLGAIVFVVELSWPAFHSNGTPVSRPQRQRLFVNTSLRR